MAEGLILLVILMVILFGGVVFFGAPYLPALKPQITAALDLLDLQPGDTMLEIGSGDGRVLAAAAERGWHAIGYELNPILVVWSRVKTRKYKELVEVHWGNAWQVRWPDVQGVYVFGLGRLMPKVYTKIVQSQRKNVKLVSLAFQIPNREPDEQADGVFLYHIKPQG